MANLQTVEATKAALQATAASQKEATQKQQPYRRIAQVITPPSYEGIYSRRVGPSLVGSMGGPYRGPFHVREQPQPRGGARLESFTLTRGDPLPDRRGTAIV
eukprot:1196062-Prorocentrum_minimum.AAC.4